MDITTVFGTVVLGSSPGRGIKIMRTMHSIGRIYFYIPARTRKPEPAYKTTSVRGVLVAEAGSRVLRFLESAGRAKDLVTRDRVPNRLAEATEKREDHSVKL